MPDCIVEFCGSDEWLPTVTRAKTGDLTEQHGVTRKLLEAMRGLAARAWVETHHYIEEQYEATTVAVRVRHRHPWASIGTPSDDEPADWEISCIFPALLEEQLASGKTQEDAEVRRILGGLDGEPIGDDAILLLRLAANMRSSIEAWMTKNITTQRPTVHLEVRMLTGYGSTTYPDGESFFFPG